MQKCDTPCILPWISFGTNPFGRARPCGYSAFKSKNKVQQSTISEEFNSDLFRSIRKDFLSGKWPQNCERCLYAEKVQPGLSKKQDNEFYAPPHRHLLRETSPDGRVKYFPKFLDIRLGTVCNLKCIHCGTGNSNKWLEDKDLLGKYANTQALEVDNSWIDRETPVWNEIHSHIHEIEKFNFIGGEPFASVQHNKFIEALSQTEHAQRISLQYVTNGVLLSEKLWAEIQKFRDISINVSLDATEDVLEFFRFPIKAEALDKKLKWLVSTKGSHVDLSLQWTSSNVSIFYLPETLDYYERNFSNIKFLFCNYVDFPAHMSPQNLPPELKEKIIAKLTPYLKNYPAIKMYIKQMTDQDLWLQQGAVFQQYLQDLSRARRKDWRSSFAQFAKELERTSNYA